MLGTALIVFGSVFGIMILLFVIFANANLVSHVAINDISEATSEPIDFVTTWHDPTDEKRLQTRREWMSHLYPERDSCIPPQRLPKLDELSIQIQSLRAYAPWLRVIHIVCSDGQRPPAAVLALDKRIRVVDDSKILGPRERPCFNSHALEANLDMVPGLSERFLYACDDMILAKPTPAAFFFSSNGGPIARHIGDMPSRNESCNNAHSRALCRTRKLLESKGAGVRRPAHHISAITRTGFHQARAAFPGPFAATSASKFRFGECDIHPVSMVQNFTTDGVWYKSRILDQMYLGFRDSAVLNSLQFNFMNFVRPHMFCINDNTTERLTRRTIERTQKYLENVVPLSSKICTVH
jgi:hypothetical protein